MQHKFQIQESNPGQLQLLYLYTTHCHGTCDFNVGHCLQGGNKTLLEDETQEESDEEDEEGAESGRVRFKSERKDGAVVRLADSGSKKRHIPETLGMLFLFS